MSSIASFNSILTKKDHASLESISNKYKKATKEETSLAQQFFSSESIKHGLSREERALMGALEKSLMRRLNRAFRLLVLENIQKYDDPALQKLLEKTIDPVFNKITYIEKIKNIPLFDIIFDSIRKKVVNRYSEDLTVFAGLPDKTSILSIIKEKQKKNSKFFSLYHPISKTDVMTTTHAYTHAYEHGQAPVLPKAFKTKATPFRLMFRENTVGGVIEYTSRTGIEKLNLYFNEGFSNKESSSQSSQEEQAEKEAVYVIKKVISEVIDYHFVKPLFSNALKATDGDKAKALLLVNNAQAYMLVRESTVFLRYCEKHPFLPKDIEYIVTGYLDHIVYVK